jgi:integrase
VQDHAAFYKRYFGPLLVEAGVVKAGNSTAKYTFHTLRHAAASMFIEQGWQSKKVQTVMGHSSITVTYDTYGHLFPSPDDDREAMAQIEARLLG